MPAPDEKARELQATIAGLEAQRSILGDSVVESAVAALRHQLAELELGGPEALTQLEVVQIFEEIAGWGFEKQFVPEDALQARKAAAANPVEKPLPSSSRRWPRRPDRPTNPP